MSDTQPSAMDEGTKQPAEIENKKDPALYFKYRPCNEFAVQMVKDGTLWFTRLTKLNDPFEGDFAFTDDAVNKMEVPKSGSAFEYKCGLLAQYRHSVKAQYYIFSVSFSGWGEIVMWSHYSMHHSGVAIGFEIPSQQDKLTDDSSVTLVTEDKKTILNKVKYQPDGVLLDIEGADDTLHDEICRIKSLQWKYENEHRLIIRNSTIRKDGYALKAKKELVKQVFFGARTPAEEIDKFILSVGRSDVEYYRLLLKNGHFKLTKVPI